MLTKLLKQGVFCLALFFCASLSGQSSNTSRLNSIDGEINKAVKAENYAEAARLKKEKELRTKLDAALKSEDYASAAELKQQIESNGGASSSGQIANLEKKLQAAIDSEEYTEASKIQKQIETLKNGGTVSSAAVSSGSASLTKEPEFVNQVYFKASDGNLHSLEKAKGELKTSGGGFYYAEAKSSYMISGNKSPIRLDRNKLSFVVKTYQGMDPSDQFKLVKLEVRGRSEDRYADAYKTSASMFHSESGQVSENDIAISFKSRGNNVFEILLEQPLSSGEYSFMYIDKMFAFGID